ncbi:MAG: O-antigen ligase family protein [Acidobacteriota bacterium]
MDRQRERPDTFFDTLPFLRITAFLILTTGGVAVAATLSASGNYREAAVFAAAALGAGLLLAGPISVQTVLITWFALAPLASFYIRFPTDRSIVTYNRVVFALIVVMLLLKSGYTAVSTQTASEAALSSRNAAPQRSSFSLSKFEVAWALLSVLALASAMARSNNFAYAMRMAIDTFWLPLVAFHVARNYLDLREGGRQLLLGGIALALFLFASGAFELVTGTDLFAYKGSEIVREGERRVNGPFVSDSSFAIVCLMLFLFLLAAPRLFRVRFDRTGKLVYACAVAGAALGALLPLFRGVASGLVLSWIVLKWSSESHNHRWSLLRAAVRRGLPLGALLVAILIALAGWIATSAPSLIGDRLTDLRSAYGRLATWKAAAEIVFDNPVLGVGLANYADYYDATHYYSDEPPEEVLETKAGGSPHSNVLWIGAELGLTGLALYIAANAYLFLMGWRALKRAADSRQRTAASCLLALVLAYSIPGLTLASGNYSDLNLYFLFLLGALYRLSSSQDLLVVSTQSQSWV